MVVKLTRKYKLFLTITLCAICFVKVSHFSNKCKYIIVDMSMMKIVYKANLINNKIITKTLLIRSLRLLSREQRLRLCNWYTTPPCPAY